MQKNNGGRWLLTLFAKEFTDGLISFEGGQTTYSRKSKISLINKYMEDLPYIIRVEGAEGIRPFYVVHASMRRISDAEIKRKISANEALSPEQIHQALWDREEDYDGAVCRTPFSEEAYSGHTIIGQKCGDAVRKNTSMINLDFGACIRDVSLAVVQKTGEVHAVVNRFSLLNKAEFIRLSSGPVLEITSYLAEKLHMPVWRPMLKSKMEELADVSEEGMIKAFHEKVTELNIAWKELTKRQRLLPMWNANVFVTYACADLTISDQTVHAVINKILNARMKAMRGKFDSEAARDEFIFEQITIADDYHRARPLGEKIETHDFRKRFSASDATFFPKASASVLPDSKTEHKETLTL
jgi:23S rRNA A1618 N6-methylase RlmF